MKKIIFIGKSGAGKTTLTQALNSQKIEYNKTQVVCRDSNYIDTPGEYIQVEHLGGALALYSYEADVIGLIQNATEQFTHFPPCITGMVNREVVGIITGIDMEDANVPLAELWLRNAGCTRIFKISSVKNIGINELIDYLNN